MNRSSSTKYALATAVALALTPAVAPAALIEYGWRFSFDFTGSDLNVAPSGEVIVTFTIDENAAHDFSHPSYHGFDLTTWRLEFIGGATDGTVFSEAVDPSFSEYIQWDNRVQFWVSGNDQQFILRFNTESIITDTSKVTTTETSQGLGNGFYYGFGYGTNEQELQNFQLVEAFGPTAAVPLPSTAALLALSMGGLALRSTALKRRAAKRAQTA